MDAPCSASSREAAAEWDCFYDTSLDTLKGPLGSRAGDERSRDAYTMRWTPGDRDNIEDRRGGGRRLAGAAPMGVGGVVLLLLLSWATGTDLFSLLDSGGAP